MYSYLGLIGFISKKEPFVFLFFSLYIDFVLANSADPDEMLHIIWGFAVCRNAYLNCPVYEGLTTVLTESNCAIASKIRTQMFTLYQ